MPHEFLQDATCDLEALFRGLVRVSSRADGDLFAKLHLLEVLPQQPGCLLFDVDFALEVHALAHLHELVGVARIAILTGELTTAVRVDSPLEWHAGGGAAIEQRTGR